MIYLAVFFYVLLLILCMSLCKISSESDKISQQRYMEIIHRKAELMCKKPLTIHYESSEREWSNFLRKLENRILNCDDEEPVETFILYRNIPQEHQDQS